MFFACGRSPDIPGRNCSMVSVHCTDCLVEVVRRRGAVTPRLNLGNSVRETQVVVSDTLRPVNGTSF